MEVFCIYKQLPNMHELCVFGVFCIIVLVEEYYWINQPSISPILCIHELITKPIKEVTFQRSSWVGGEGWHR